MTINELLSNKQLTVRSFNVCNENSLKDISDIIKYYSDNKTFEKLRNCGKKSNDELVALCLKSIDTRSIYTVESSNPQSNLSLLISDFSRVKREILNNYIEINANYLSIRSSNALKSFLNGNLKIRNIIEKILSNREFSFRDLKNVGLKSQTELESFFDSIIEFIEQIHKIQSENELVALRNRYLIQKGFSISEIPIHIQESQSIFTLVHFLLHRGAIFVNIDNSIFIKAFKIYINQPETSLDKIAEELNFSKERIRQKREYILDSLLVKFHFVKNIEDNLFQKYNIDLNQDLIRVEEDLNSLINSVNQTNFSKEFNAFLIYVHVSDEFDLIGELADVLTRRSFNSKDRHNWNNFYLVKKSITKVFDFKAFADDLNKRLSDRIDEEYRLNFNSYVLEKSSLSNLDYLKTLTEVAEAIINFEFDLYINTDENLTFPRNTPVQNFEYAYEALKKLQRPSKISEITKKIKELHPEYITNDEKVRTSMQRHYLFVSIGRSSVFGLKEWENELKDFRGGTIRVITKEYLLKYGTPQKYSDVASYVSHFRPKTNVNSIVRNLKADNSKQFVFFKNSLIGLSEKTYDDSFIKQTYSELVETKSWQERYNELNIFLTKHNRLPFSSGCSESEIKLYRWFALQVRNKRRGNIDLEKSNLIDELIKKFDGRVYSVLAP